MHKLVAQQGQMLKMLENKDKAEHNGQTNGTSPDPNPTPGPGPSAKWAGVKINRTGRDVEMNQVYNVTNNSDSNNTYTNSTVNKNNTSTVNNNYNRVGDTVSNDYSVKNPGGNYNFAGASGFNFAGASGINFGSNNTNNMGRS